MTTPVLITIIIGGITVIAHYVNGYLQRKQMRQIEMYKADPKVGLTPAAHPVTGFIKSNWYLLPATIAAVFLITKGFLRAHGPMGPEYDVGLGAMSLVFVMLAYSDKLFANRAADDLELRDELIRKIIDILAETRELSIETREKLEALTKRRKT